MRHPGPRSAAGGLDQAQPSPQNQESHRRHLRDHAVSEESEPICAIDERVGHPMSHSTNRGFKVRGHAQDLGPGVEGVGAWGPERLMAMSVGLAFASVVVGQQRPRVSNDGRIAPTRPAAPPWFVPYELALGVGHSVDVGGEDEDPLSSVR